MTTLESFFDNIGRAITSMAAVIFVLIMTITGMIFFSHTLFIQVFPASMEPWEKLTATWLMALGWEFTVLLTTCNTRHINKQIPAMMAVASGVIVLFFIQAFDDTQPWLIIVQRWFIGLLAGTINYIYAELFYAKWKERNEQQELPQRLVQLQTTIDQSNQQLHQAGTDMARLQSKLDEAGRELAERERAINQLGREAGDLMKFKAKVERDLTCPHCKLVQESYGTLQAHKGYCEANPHRRGAAANGISKQVH